MTTNKYARRALKQPKSVAQEYNWALFQLTGITNQLRSMASSGKISSPTYGILAFGVEQAREELKTRRDTQIKVIKEMAEKPVW